MHIFADGFSKLSLSNNNIRIVLTQNAPNNEQVETATLIIPASSYAAFVNGMANSLKQLEEQIKAKTQEAQSQADKNDLQ